MNSICDLCGHQERKDHEDKLQCYKAEYEHTPNHGSFKQGCKCIYDDDLGNLFIARTEQSHPLKQMVIQIGNLEKQLAIAREARRDLECKLLKIKE